MKPNLYISFLLILPFLAVGQNLKVPTLSPYSQIVQEIGLTEITLQYSKPSKKGRIVFGELVPYDKIWRTGANAATKLIFKEDVKIAGNPLAAGSYALYTIPGRDTWTIIIHTNTGHRSIAGDRYKQEEDAFRFQIPAIQNPFTEETFNIRFGDITTNSCNLVISWENTIVRFPIEVEVHSKIKAQMNELLKDQESISHRTYFRAAEYYLHNRIDLIKSMEWIDAALEKSVENYRYGLLKSKIYAAQGDKDSAIETVKKANEWATANNNSNYIEQTRIYWEELLKSEE